MSAVGVMVAAHCGRVEPRRPAISGTRSRNRGVPGRSTAVSCASTSESLDMCVITSADPPPPPCVSTRRGVVGTTLLSAFAAALFPNFALAEDDDESEEDAQAAIEASMRNVLKVNSGEFSYPRQVAFRDGSSMRASFEVSSLWSVVGKASTGGAAGVGAGDAESSKDSSKDAPKSTTTWQEIVDPVNGKVVQNVTLFFTKNFPSQSIADLGKPENVSVAKALGLASDDSYRRADMLGASKRTATDGQVYYDWDMVASPPAKQCPSAVGCLYPDHIYLMSATVRGGDLFVLSVDAFPKNWRQAGNSLKRIRGSFEVRPDSSEVEAVEGETSEPL